MNSCCFALALVLCARELPAGQAPSAGLLDQARQLQEKGALKEAGEAYRALIAKLRRPGSDERQLSAALLGLANVEIGSGEYTKAIDTAGEAAALCHRLSDPACEARGTNWAGVARFNLGDWEAAISDFGSSLALARRLGDIRLMVLLHGNIGGVYSLQGRYQDAFLEYQRGLDLLKGTEAQEWHSRSRQVILNNIATLFQRLGQYRRALDIYRELDRGGLSGSEQARVYLNLGTAYRRLGDPVKALDYYEQARKISLSVLKHDIEIGILKNVGIAQAMDLDNLQAALDSFGRALELAEQSSNRHEASQAHLYLAEALMRLGRHEDARGQYEAALVDLASGEEEWKVLYGLGRIAAAQGRSADARRYFQQAIAGIESLRSGLESRALRSEFLANKRDVYDALMSLLLAEPRPDAAVVFDLMERSRARLFQDDLARRAETLLARTHGTAIARLRGLRSRLAFVTRQQSAAPPAERPALAGEIARLEREYASAQRALEEALPGGGYRPASLASVQARLDDSTALLMLWDGPGAIGVLWVTHQRAGLAAAPVVPSDLLHLLAALSAPGGNWRQPAAELGAALFAGVPPLADPRTQHLILVPDGDLQWVPFEALGRPTLIERFDVFYLPAAAMMLRPAPPAALAPPWRKQLLALADPVAGEYLPGDERWQRLPNSAQEVRAIAAELPGRAELHIGASASKAVLLSGRGRGVPLLHLSTHAAIDAEESNRSRILLSAAAGKGNDYLFLSEVPALDLTGVELVTLSACETELGRLVRSEGVRSFSRAFLLAGARSTVSTLWRVADEPTAEFMRLFYHELAHGASKSEALRTTKLRFLHAGGALAHPSYWAAFVLNGDGLTPLSPQVSWASVFAALGAVLLLGALAWRLRRN